MWVILQLQPTKSSQVVFYVMIPNLGQGVYAYLIKWVLMIQIILCYHSRIQLHLHFKQGALFDSLWIHNILLYSHQLYLTKWFWLFLQYNWRNSGPVRINNFLRNRGNKEQNCDPNPRLSHSKTSFLTTTCTALMLQTCSYI